MPKKRVPQKRNTYKDSSFYGTPLKANELKNLAGFMDTLVLMDMEAKYKNNAKHKDEANAN